MNQRPAEERLAPSVINWLPWGKLAFEQAQSQNKPVLLSIGAVWCYWCHVMDEETYTDPDVSRYVNENFVPVRVDNDHRPDINLRYNVGGWPSTAFLTGHGGHIAGATYLPPDQLLSMMMEVQRTYQQQKAEIYDQSNAMLRQRREEVNRIAAGAELTAEMVDRIARRAAGTYDARNGGFGEAPKFPGAPILGLLLHLFRTTKEEFYRVMLEKTLDRMAESSLFDPVDGGLFRYSATPDWSQAQYEKMLEDNVGLSRTYLTASLLLDQPFYGEVASRTIDFILNNLYDENAAGFRGSQGAHSEYYTLPAEARTGKAAPPLDPFCYTSGSAQAASLLVYAAWTLGRPELLHPAAKVLEKLDSMAQAGVLTHAYSAMGPAEDAPSQHLADWAHLLNALMDAANAGIQSEKYLHSAREVAAVLSEMFGDASRGGFFDVEHDPEAVGYMRVREKPLPDNVAAAQGLMKLAQATGEEAYLETARQTLIAYVDANRAYGEFAAAYAVAVDQSLHEPVEVTIEGSPGNPDTHTMLKSVAQIAYPDLVLKLAETAPDAPAQAHICLNTVCLPPVSNPDDLASAIQEALTPQESPFQNIFQQFGGL